MGCIESHVEMDLENRDITSKIQECHPRMLTNTECGNIN
jgi:hypothetical protein